MKKIIYSLALFFINIGFSQVYEAGISYNLGNAVGDTHGIFPINSSSKSFGVILKKNMNPRIAYRLGVNLLESSYIKIAEASFGIDYNFLNFNLIRSNSPDNQTLYVIFEAASMLYHSGDDVKFSVVLPAGLGYKHAITNRFVASIEAKGRVAFTDELDNVQTNGSTFDAYYYIGTSIYYTFGWPKGSKNQIRF